MKANVKLIVGLGNPGSAYKHTRHNAGARAVEKFAKKNGFLFKSNRSFKSLVASAELDGHEVFLMLPQTFMNLSGEAVAQVAKKKGINFCDVLIVCDDVALPLGRIKVKTRGSDGGHNGLASVLEKLSTREIPRLRIGIGGDKIYTDLSDYVLSSFKKDEGIVLNTVLDNVVLALDVWVKEGIQRCMNRFNQMKPRLTEQSERKSVG